MNENEKDFTGYVAKSGIFGRYVPKGDSHQYLAIQFEYYPYKDSNEMEITPVMLLDEETARKIGKYFFLQSFINPFRNLFKK